MTKEEFQCSACQRYLCGIKKKNNFCNAVCEVNFKNIQANKKWAEKEHKELTPKERLKRSLKARKYYEHDQVFYTNKPCRIKTVRG